MIEAPTDKTKMIICIINGSTDNMCKINPATG